MAEKILQTRIINKHAELETWKISNLQLKEGEIALAKVMVAQKDGTEAPTYVAKIGLEGKTFAESPMLFAPASDVYEWAKADTKPGYTATEIARGTSNVATDLGKVEDEITTLKAAIGAGGSVADAITAAIEALDVDDAAVANQFVTAVAEADGKISVTRRALEAADIPALGLDKITGLEDALNAKANANDVKQTTDAISARLDENGDIDVAIKAAKKAGDDAQTYAEGVNTAFGEYKTANDAEVAAVRGIAEAARTETEVDGQIDAKIATFKSTVTDKIDERVVANATAISTEKSRAEGVESGLDTRLTTVEGKVDALSSATHFLGVKTELPATAAKGDIVIVGSKEYVYDPEATVTVEGTKWVELGDTTAEQARIKAVEDNVADILADLGEDGDTTLAIKAAQDAADAAQADADEANRLIGIINGSGEGSITRAVSDATSALQTYADDKASAAQTAAEATAKGYTDTEVKKANDAAAAAQTAIDTHSSKQDNPHNVTAEQVGLGKVENKTVAEIKTEFTGAVADGNDKFVTGDAVYDAIEAAKTAANGYTDTEVGKVDQKADTNATDITTIKNTYARVSGDQLVYGQGADEMVIIFDCGGAN